MITDNKHKNNFLFCLIILFLVSVTKFFYLVSLPYPFSNEASNILFPAFIATLVFFIFVGDYGRIFFGAYGKSIVLLFGILIFNAIYMYTQYDFSFATAFGSQFFYLILLAYFPIIYYLNSWKKLCKFMNVIEVISIILCCVLLVQLVLFYSTGIKFIKITALINGNGRIYSVAEGFIRISVLISAYKLISNKFKFSNIKKSFINLILSVFCILNVDQSRVYFLSVAASIVIMIILNNGFKLKISKLFLYIVVIIGIVYLIYLISNSLLLTLGDSTNGSNYARRDAIQYYLPLIKEHIWTGLGNVIVGSSNNLYSYLKGPMGIYNYNDLGIFGILVSLGILGALWYLWVIIKGWQICKKKSNIKILNYGLFFEMLFSSLTMSYLDYERLISLLLVLVFLSYSYGE